MSFEGVEGGAVKMAYVVNRSEQTQRDTDRVKRSLIG